MIFKYNCLLTNYYKKELVSSEEKIKTYEKIGNFIEYAYDLKKIGINEISKVDLENPTIKKIINELNNVKIINVSLKENYLVIEKEIVLYGYSIEDIYIEIEDISIFYNRLILPILDIINKNE